MTRQRASRAETGPGQRRGHHAARGRGGRSQVSITWSQKYHRPMIHFLFRMVRNQAVAEELAQEVFLRVYRARESYRAEARFTTWLYRIATNLAVNHARDTRHERAAQTVYLDAAGRGDRHDAGSGRRRAFGGSSGCCAMSAWPRSAST